MELATIEKQILSALKHPEAEEGLYLGNFNVLHEEDERPRVEASEIEILDALKCLIEQGTVLAQDQGESVVFLLGKK